MESEDIRLPIPENVAETGILINTAFVIGESFHSLSKKRITAAKIIADVVVLDIINDKHKKEKETRSLILLYRVKKRIVRL